LSAICTVIAIKLIIQRRLGRRHSSIDVAAYQQRPSELSAMQRYGRFLNSLRTSQSQTSSPQHLLRGAGTAETGRSIVRLCDSELMCEPPPSYDMVTKHPSAVLRHDSLHTSYQGFTFCESSPVVAAVPPPSYCEVVSSLPHCPSYSHTIIAGDYDNGCQSTVAADSDELQCVVVAVGSSDMSSDVVMSSLTTTTGNVL
jgi:hypothetical protein